MPIDVEKGFHKGTLLSCVLAITAQSIMTLIILPTMPFMVQFYIPEVVLCILNETRLTSVK